MSFFTAPIRTFLINRISNIFTANGNREISGPDARDVLLDMVGKIDEVGRAAVITYDVVGDHAHTVPATSLVLDMVIIPSVDGVVKIGTSIDGSELYDYDGYEDELEIADVKQYFREETVLYFTGNFRIKFKQENYV